MTHVNAGYILNRMQTMIAGSYVTCPDGKRIAWSIDLAAIPLGGVVNMPPRANESPKVGTTIVAKTKTTRKRAADRRHDGEGG